jgi:hypothetical protein
MGPGSPRRAEARRNRGEVIMFVRVLRTSAFAVIAIAGAALSAGSGAIAKQSAIAKQFDGVQVFRVTNPRVMQHRFVVARNNRVRNFARRMTAARTMRTELQLIELQRELSPRIDPQRALQERIDELRARVARSRP